MSNFFKLAENLLNNLDQSAQTSIQGALHNNKTSKKSSNSESNNSTNPDYSSSRYDSKLTSSVNGQNSLRQNSSFTVNGNKQQKSTKKTKDDELIEFLNSDLNASNTSTDLTNLKAPLMTRSMIELKNNASDNESNAEESVKNDHEEEDVVEKSNVEFLVGDSEQNGEQNDSKLSQLLSENKRLKNEIQNLNSEIKSLLTRIKSGEDEYQRSKRKIDHFQNQISESDKIIRELRSREDDMTESIKSKESQIAVLRVKFDECDKDLKLKKIELDNLKVESDRLLREHSNSSDIQSQAFETLKEKLSEHEISLQREKDAFVNAQVILLKRL